MKYCCSKFEGDCFIGNSSAPKMRIVKFATRFIVPQIKLKNKTNNLRFFITLGYEKFTLDSVLINICYCPYCGTNLYEFYDNDEYANEIEGETFVLRSI